MGKSKVRLICLLLLKMHEVQVDYIGFLSLGGKIVLYINDASTDK